MMENATRKADATENIKCIVLALMLVLTSTAAAQDYERVKGYYRVWQTTDSVLSYFWDGYMEIYVPKDTSSLSEGSFCDRKFLGERRRKATSNNGDDIFIQVNLPNLEALPLANSITGDEYSTRNNGDIYLLKYKAGNISHTDSATTITMDELAGRPDHSLDMSQLKIYGIVATMTDYVESETRLTTTGSILSFSKHTEYLSHYKGEDVDERITVTSEFYVTARQDITKAELKKIKKAKNRIWQFNVPTDIPPLPHDIASAWTKLIEY